VYVKRKVYLTVFSHSYVVYLEKKGTFTV